MDDSSTRDESFFLLLLPSFLRAYSTFLFFYRPTLQKKKQQQKHKNKLYLSLALVTVASIQLPHSLPYSVAHHHFLSCKHYHKLPFCHSSTEFITKTGYINFKLFCFSFILSSNNSSTVVRKSNKQKTIGSVTQNNTKKYKYYL